MDHPVLTDLAVDILVLLVERPASVSELEQRYQAVYDARPWMVENACSELFWAELAREDEYTRAPTGHLEKVWRLADRDQALAIIRAYRPEFYLEAEEGPRLRPSSLTS